MLVARIVVPVVPAPGPLAEVAADRAHVADLRRADLAGGHREQRRLLLHERVLDDVREQSRRADAEPAGPARMPCSSFEVPDVDKPLGRGEVVLHLAEQVGAAGDQRDLAVFLPQLGGRLPEASRAGCS